MAYQRRSNADFADARFTGRITLPPLYEENKQKKDKSYAPYISLSIVSNADDYSNFKKCYSQHYAWGKLASKINALGLVKGDGIEIDCKYESIAIETKEGQKANIAKFKISRLVIISFAKEIVEEDLPIDVPEDEA